MTRDWDRPMTAEDHEQAAVHCYGMADAAYGVGATLDGQSYAESATWHAEQAATLRREAATL